MSKRGRLRCRLFGHEMSEPPEPGHLVPIGSMRTDGSYSAAWQPGHVRGVCKRCGWKP